MKSTQHLIMLVLLTIFTFSCKNEVTPEVKTVSNTTEKATPKVAKIDSNAKYAKAEFKIEGMTCAVGCAKTIEKKMAKMEGVKSATVDFDKQLAMVEYDEAKVTPTSLVNTVTSVADIYKVKDMHNVDKFSKKECAADCKKDCCKNKIKTEKKACSKDCKKACCVKAEKA